MPYGIVVLPDTEVSQRLTRFSNEIAGTNAITALEAQERPPHLTVLSFDSDREVADRLWSEVLESVGPSLPVRLTGLMFTPVDPGDYWVPEGGLHFGLEAISTEALRGAHAEVLRLATTLGSKPLGGTGDSFSPHITLGILRSFPVSVSLRSDVLGTSFTGTMAMGRLGNYGTYPEILNRA